MKPDKTRFACCRFFLYAMLLSVFMAWLAGVLFADGEPGMGIGCAVFALFFFAVPLLITPFCYRFDPEGVTMCYLFVPNERYLWRKIRGIEVDYGGRDPAAFQLDAKPEGERRFYMDGKLCKNHRTRRLLETYWDGTITGFFFDGRYRRWRSRKTKIENEQRRHLTDEVAPMERAARAEARAMLALYDAQAAQLGLKLRIRFCYTTEALEEENSRPDSNYAYTVLAELGRPSETDERRIITVGADLLRVRLARSAYRGVRDEDALSVLRQELSGILEEVRANGMEACCGSIEEE